MSVTYNFIFYRFNSGLSRMDCFVASVSAIVVLIFKVISMFCESILSYFSVWCLRYISIASLYNQLTRCSTVISIIIFYCLISYIDTFGSGATCEPLN